MRNFIRGIKNLWKWFPIVWKDRDFDYHYLLILMKFKLKDIERFFSSDKTMSVGIEKCAKNVKICRILLDRILKDDYSCWDVHDKKWGRGKLSFENNTLEIIRSNVKTEKDKEVERKEFMRCYEQDVMLKDQDYEYLFKLLYKHIENWWD